MRILTHSDLFGLVPLKELVACVAAAAARSIDVEVPARTHIAWGENTLLTMPAVDGERFGVKLISVVPGNASQALPVTNGLMMLADGTTGLPLAMMDAAGLTALRTGAIGAVALQRLAPRGLSSIGIVGCGVQGAWQAIFAAKVCGVSAIFCASRSPASVARFQALVLRHVPDAKITMCTDARGVITRSDAIVTTTTSTLPVLPDAPAIFRQKYVAGFGSFKPTTRELPDAVFRDAAHVITDCAAAVHESGDLSIPIAHGILHRENVRTLGDVIRNTYRPDTTRTTVFKSVGMALYDLHVAQRLYDAAIQSGVGQEIDLRR